MKTKLTKADFIIITAALLTAVLLFVIPFCIPKGGTLTVAASGQKTVYYPLSDDCEFEVTNNGITLTVEIKNGVARVLHSGCGNQVCVNSGGISRAGQSIICAPAGISLTVAGGVGGESDAVAG